MGVFVVVVKVAKEDAGVKNFDVACFIVEIFGKDVILKDFDEMFCMEYCMKLFNL